jgi:hypothetical protein
MATVNKDFKIKSGLIVEGTTATVNGYDILTKKQDDQNYIIGLIGGSATSEATPDTVVLRDGDANFAANNITVNTLYVGGSTNNGIDVVSGNTEVGSNNGIVLSAQDDINLNTGSGAVNLNVDNGAYVNEDEIVTRTASQTLTNKTVSGLVAKDTTSFRDGNNSEYLSVGVSGTGTAELYAYDDIALHAQHDVILYPGDSGTGKAYIHWGNDSTNSHPEREIATHGYVDGEISTLDTAAQGYADSALTSANSYTDGEITSALTTAQGYATTAQGNAEDYADGLVGQEVTDRNSAISSAITALDLSNTYDAKGDAAQALADANTYTDGKVSDLVDSAPDLLNTLNELAAAIADNPNYATDVASAVSGRVAKSGDTMTGDLVLPGAPTLNLHAATKGYVDTTAATAQGNAEDYADTVAGTAYTNAVADAASDATTKATNAYNDAVTYANGLAVNYDAAGSAVSEAAAALSDANDYTDTAISGEVTNRNSAITSAIDALSTSDIEEGSNLYFTDGRAKTSAADLLTGASLTNITITGTGAGLTITAENGVADSDTDDLTEGTTNLYFTAQRAVDALEAVVPNFTSVELNSVALQVAATTSAPTAGIQVAHGFLKADWRSAEYLVKVAYGTHTEISKVLLTLDTSDNIAITEYGIVGTNGSASSISAGVSGDTVQLQVTTANNNSTVTVMGTLLK